MADRPASAGVHRKTSTRVSSSLRPGNLPRLSSAPLVSTGSRTGPCPSDDCRSHLLSAAHPSCWPVWMGSRTADIQARPLCVCWLAAHRRTMFARFGLAQRIKFDQIDGLGCKGIRPKRRSAGRRPSVTNDFTSGLSERRAGRHNWPIGQWPIGEAARLGQPQDRDNGDQPDEQAERSGDVQGEAHDVNGP